LLITADPEVPGKLYGGIERIINSLCAGLTAQCICDRGRGAGGMWGCNPQSRHTDFSSAAPKGNANGFLLKAAQITCETVADLDKVDRAPWRRRNEKYFSVQVIATHYERPYKDGIVAQQ
jgi:hypothetical protein